MHIIGPHKTWSVRLVAILAAAPIFAFADERTVEERLRALEMQNEALREQLSKQEETIQQLRGALREEGGDLVQEREKDGGFSFGKVHISGEGGVGFFHTGQQGDYADNPFRVDEAKLFVEAPVWDNTWVFAELDLVTREANDEFFHLGELYLDVENILRWWTDKSYLSLRVGRIDIPFGEEYLVRDVIDNPLISHSLGDLWGIDEGIELYGSAAGFDYVVAVQNGGHPTLEDGHSDKSVAGRIGYNFKNGTRLSFSGMRTGKLSPTEDRMSEMWFGNGFFRSIGSEATTTTYEANLFELDAQKLWRTGHLKLAGGYVDYGDNDSSANNEREAFYYYTEGLKRFGKFYGASRFSHIIADEGLPLVGHGRFGRNFFTGPLTTDFWRWSFGVGYRWSDHFITKLEYAHERREVVGSGDSQDENFMGAELGFKF